MVNKQIKYFKCDFLHNNHHLNDVLFNCKQQLVIKGLLTFYYVGMLIKILVTD